MDYILILKDWSFRCRVAFLFPCSRSLVSPTPGTRGREAFELFPKREEASQGFVSASESEESRAKDWLIYLERWSLNKAIAANLEHRQCLETWSVIWRWRLELRKGVWPRTVLPSSHTDSGRPGCESRWDSQEKCGLPLKVFILFLYWHRFFSFL